MLLRRKWLALAIFALCVAGAGVLCAVLPASYRSSTLILVEGQKIPENYVQAVIGPTIEERLNSLQQQVMSRTVLTRMIEEFGLYPDMVRANGMDAVVEKVRKDIKVETMGARSQRGGIDAFSISFAHENPLVAMNVTSRLASQFIEENLKVREQLVAGASEFLEQELALAKERLEAQEKTISHYKTKYMGELPEQVPANISALDRLQAQHSTATEAIQKATDRLTLIEKLIKEYESPAMAGVATVQGPGGVVVVDPLVARLRELEKNLATLSAEYKETYPDIAYLKQEIQAVKAQLKEKKDVGGENNDAKEPSAPAKESKPADLYLRELMRQRDEAKLEISSLKERLARTRAEMSEYEKRVEMAPTREQELEILVRDYNNLKENYRTLLDKKLNARLAENLEKRQKGEQFRIIDPANLPAKPDKPDRMKIMLLGLLLGCGLGAGSAIGLELLRPVFRRSEDVESLLHLRVIASIPSFKSLLGGAQKNLYSKPMTATRRGNRLLASRMPAGEPNGKNGVGRSLEETPTPALTKRYRSGRANVLRELEVIGKWNPWSVVAEQFRVAATRLALLQYASKGKVTVITSAVKGEGKSVVAANLAYAFARDMGKRTLLIDGDLKCPSVHEYWGIPEAPGLRDVLQGSQSLEACLRQEGDLPLWILPSGSDRGRATDDLSRISQISEMLGDVRHRYDFIIIDAPPVLPLADMHMMAGLADIVTIVIRAGLTPRNVVETALRSLGAAANKISIILNELEARGIPYYMHQGYGYPVGKKEAGVT
jgi:polysaccharide chain length determinant protein (PEP-CTERM system associated)